MKGKEIRLNGYILPDSVKDVYANVLRKETKRQLMKYYNETEII